MKTWTKLFNQYEFEHVSSIFLTLIQTAKRFKIQDKYDNDWPIRDALKLRLKYTSDWEKKKDIRKMEAKLKQVLRPKEN